MKYIVHVQDAPGFTTQEVDIALACARNFLKAGREVTITPIEDVETVQVPVFIPPNEGAFALAA